MSSFDEVTLEPLLDAACNFKEMLFQENWRIANRPKGLRSLVEDPLVPLKACLEIVQIFARLCAWFILCGGDLVGLLSNPLGKLVLAACIALNTSDYT